MERSYRVLNKDDIHKNLEDHVTRLSCVLSVPRPAAAILLHNYTWQVDKLLRAWFDDEDGVRESVGLPKNNRPTKGFPRSGEVLVCGICFRTHNFDIRFESTVGFCGHRFCTSCLGAYVSRAIDDGPACLFLRCPDRYCGAVIGQDMVDLVVSDEGKMKYKEFSIRAYVENNNLSSILWPILRGYSFARRYEIKWENNRGIKWCPALGFEYAIEYNLKSASYDVSERFDVTCDCSFSFYWNCLEESHRPVKCETVANWVLENSYRENVEGEVDVEERVTKSAKRSYRRYFHYYERWVANHKSRENALAFLNVIKTEKLEQLRELVEEHGLKARKFGFLAEAWEQIAECRRVLKWSYVYGYYMPEEASLKTKLFEYLQGEAEVALERLHDCAENTLEKYLKLDGLAHEFDATKTELVNRTCVTRIFFANFVNGVSNGLAEAESNS
ncbi:RBR-type E3 ubiquitin transferase [Heracleum sosnowskyi]|uniref:RBR-type E3 ubiquitin transferase n=1 Tax=Heracleum sosnowskyi TaxID=360622 RepID=A0AAD8IC75_9APIA|nr:RBR-type E3 ubiquitin transferase [Heracleum sosnowskyi]